MVDQGLWDRPNHKQGADHTHLESRDLPNYTVSAEVIGFGVLYRASIWARVPFYGETLQQEKGTRPKNELIVEIYSKSLVRSIGKVLCMRFS